MPHVSSLLAVALVSLGMVLTPGPNMIYPSWLLIQRYLMGTVLAGLAVWMALETRRA